MSSLSKSSLPPPLYRRIKEHIIGQIRNGDLATGGRLPSEAELVETLGASRMTVHRALRELSEAGIVERVQGLGTFVAESKKRSELMEVTDIGVDVINRGETHSVKVKDLAEIRAQPHQCLYFDIQRGSKLFRSLIVNMEDGVPVQVEDRLVLPSFAPGYLTNDFHSTSATRYLNAVAEATEVEHVVYATTASSDIRELLDLDQAKSCMVVTRRTWVDRTAVTFSTFTYPGDTYGLVSRRKLL